MARKRMPGLLAAVRPGPDAPGDARPAMRIGLPAVAAQRKAERRKERARQWKRAVEEKAKARLQAQASAEAPLQHMETLHSSLAAIEQAVSGSSAPGKTAGRPLGGGPRAGGRLTAKGRARVLAAERERFAAVMRHPVFQRDPSAAVHGHLAHALPGGRSD